MKVFVGVDGGGTHARAVAIDTHARVLARVTGPAGIVAAGDPRAAAAVVRTVIEDVLTAATGVSTRAAAVCCGLAGAGRAAERDAVRTALEAAGVAASVTVTGDAETAMYDAFRDGPGILVIAGTGSIAWARGADGGLARAGGWGQLLGDGGSGYAVGLDALRRVARAADGVTGETRLTEVVLAAAALSEPAQLIAWAAAASKADIAALSPAVLHCAASGDAAAIEIREHAVLALLEITEAAARRAGVAGGGAVPFALHGGLVAPGGPLRDALVAAIGERLPGARPTNDTIDAARGAALLALARYTG